MGTPGVRTRAAARAQLENSSPQPVTTAVSARRMPSATDLQTVQLLAVLASLWLVAVSSGILLHEDMRRGERKAVQDRLPLLWFDFLLRQYGPLLPLPIVLTRFWCSALSEGQSQAVRPAPHFFEAGCMYIGISVARLIVYLLHRVGLFHLLSRSAFVPAVPADVMSDHILLGASLSAILAAELVFLVQDCRQVRPQRISVFNATCITVGLVLAALLFVLIAGDVHFTARYFHGRWETLWAVVGGALLFQGPTTWWLLKPPTAPFAIA